MNYNWGEPKKNSKLTAIMMTKAEASRKKRLSSVKSTLSNQLHPGTEGKLKKKKKSPESARREAGEFDPEILAPAFKNNNHLEPTYDDPNDLADSNNGFNGPEEYSASSQHSKSTPIFEEFSLNAAAEGLFHPASTIEAFIEHDAKYNDKIIKAKGSSSSKPSSGRSSLSSRSGSRSSTVGEYLPSLENQKLPVLLNEKGKRVKLDSTLSSSSLLASPGRGSSASRNFTMTSTRSDSDLHAPRRLGAVPSSADRNALDFYDHEDGTDDESEDDHLNAGVRAKSSPPNLGNFSLSSAKSIGSTKSLGGSKSASTLSSEPQQQLDDSLLTKKFEDLKLLMSAKKKAKPVVSSGQQHTGAPPDTTVTSTKPHNKSREGSSPSANTVTTTSSSSSAVKLAEKATGKSRTAKPTSSTTTKSISDERRYTSVPIVVKTPPIRSKKDMKIRNGVSLSDLKEEHRAALEMLKELGGPVDTDYESVADTEEKTAKLSAKVHISSRSTRAKETGKTTPAATLSRYQKQSLNSDAGKTETSTSVTAPVSSASPRAQTPESEPQSPSPMSHAGGSLVAKLRASIPSGRIKTPEPTEEAGADRVAHLPADDETTMTPAALDGTKDPVSSAAAMSAASFVLCRQERSLENVEEVDEEDDAEVVGNDVETASQHDGEPDLQQIKFDDSWKQYEDEEEDDEEEDGEPLDDAGGDDQFANEFNRSAPVTARSVDMYGDEGFESEW
ncbi:hypothetical protein Gpo141_00003434 [Globisporangium polare]